ncbi:hypothetical protein MHBO_001815, partial [Bonamia ostreae]
NLYRLKMSKNLCVVDSFCLKLFENKTINISPSKFENKINQLFRDKKIKLLDGYAPFCKHLIVPNFVDNCFSSILPITAKNRHLLTTKYLARTAKELPVMVRYFKASENTLKRATFLDVILYDREQIRKENKATGTETTQKEPFGIVSVKPQLTEEELPMEPITMMRNALPLQEGGSGVALDHSLYQKSVQFWSENAKVVFDE